MNFDKFEKIIDKIIFALKNVSIDNDIVIRFSVNEDNELFISVMSISEKIIKKIKE